MESIQHALEENLYHKKNPLPRLKQGKFLWDLKHQINIWEETNALHLTLFNFVIKKSRVHYKHLPTNNTNYFNGKEQTKRKKNSIGNHCTNIAKIRC